MKTIIAALLIIMVSAGLYAQNHNTKRAHRHYLERRAADFVRFYAAVEDCRQYQLYKQMIQRR